MRIVEQRNNHDCGICCIAMLCDVSYEASHKIAKKFKSLQEQRFEKLPDMFAQFGFDSQIYNEMPTKPKYNGLIEVTQLYEGEEVFHYISYDAEKGQILNPWLSAPKEFNKLRFLEVKKH